MWFSTPTSELEEEDREQISKIYLPDHNNPELLIHCSGGIGRSGTFLTAFHHYSQYRDVIEKKELRQNIPEIPITSRNVRIIQTSRRFFGPPSKQDKQAVSLKETVHFMRLQRHPWMVEGEHQYTLAYQIVIYLLKNHVLNICK